MFSRLRRTAQFCIAALCAFPYFGQSLANAPGAWQNLEAKFYRAPDKQKLDQEQLLASSGYFRDASTGWLVGTNGKWLGESRGMTAHTIDGGKRWDVTFSPMPSQFSDVFFTSEGKGWIVGSEQSSQNRSVGVLLESRDNGRSWQKRTIGSFYRSDFSSVYFSSENDGYIAGGIESEGQRRGIVFRTSDGGISWTLVASGTNSGVLRDVKFDPAGQSGWAVGEDGEILNSQDRGQTWHRQRTSFSGTFSRLAVLNSKEVWVTASDRSLLHTEDGGITWKVTVPTVDQAALKDSVIWFSGVVFDGAERGWVSGSDGIILGTRDRGKSWHTEAVGRGEFLYKLIKTNGAIVAIGKDGTLLRREIQ